jgi:hypothetical protein
MLSSRPAYCARDVCFAPAFQIQIARVVLRWKTREPARGSTERRLVIEGAMYRNKLHLIFDLIGEMFIKLGVIYSG